MIKNPRIRGFLSIQLSCSFYYSGKLAADDPFAAEYIKQIIKKLSYKAQGRRHSGETDIPEYNIINELKEKFGVDIDDNG